MGSVMTTWAHTRHRCMGPDNMLESILGWAHAYHTVHVVMPNRCWALLGMHPMPSRGVGHLSTPLYSGVHPSPTCSGSGALLEPNMLGSKQCAWTHFSLQMGSSPTPIKDFFGIPHESLSISYWSNTYYFE
jgi:hypothetical protein